MEQEVKETSTAVSVLDDYSVIVVDQERLQAFFSDGKNLDDVYGHIEKMAKGLVADVTTKEGVSQIKSCARQIASSKTKIDNLGKQVVAELKQITGGTANYMAITNPDVLKAIYDHFNPKK